MPGINKDKESDFEGLDNNQPDGQQPPTQRELTQTDRINRHLLVAFLQSLNQASGDTPRTNSENSNYSNSLSSDHSEWNDNNETSPRQ